MGITKLAFAATLLAIVAFNSPGNAQTRTGNITLYSNGIARLGTYPYGLPSGLSSQDIGNTRYYSNGVIQQRIGNTNTYSNNKTCQTIDITGHCN
jgi:hypothetical protein